MVETGSEKAFSIYDGNGKDHATNSEFDWMKLARAARTFQQFRAVCKMTTRSCHICGIDGNLNKQQ